MKKILCFGDSNTFGFNPHNGLRYSESKRWSGILANNLRGFIVIEAGCNNRNCFCDNGDIELTGCKILPKYLENDLDYVILALGTNDIQKFYRPSDSNIQEGIENLIDIVKKNCPQAKILLLSPSCLSKDILKGYFKCQFDETSIEQSKRFFELYSAAASKKGCDIIDLNKIARVSEADGLHYDVEEHEKIAQALTDYFLK